jgi:hypothetical protein
MSQNIPGLHDFLALAHWPATERLRDLMNRVKIADLSVTEVVALVAIFEAADQRKGTRSAPVLRLTPRDGRGLAHDGALSDAAATIEP